MASRLRKSLTPMSSAVPPQEDPAETLERVVPKRQIQIERDDVLILRERTPRLNPRPIAAPPFRYRVRQHKSDDLTGHIYSSFQHAASAADSLADRHQTRVLYIEDETPLLLSDYRPTPRKGRQ